MKSKKVVLTLAIGSFASSAFAGVNNFSVSRSGGGQLHGVVSLSKNGADVIAQVESCNFRELSDEQKQSTIIKLKDADKEESLAILNNFAVIASKVEVIPSFLAGGSWLNFSLNVSYSGPGLNAGMTSKDIDVYDPIILIDGELSDVLNRVETLLHDSSASVCGY